jgi:hypothetical protein
MKHRQVYNPLLVYDVYLKTASYKYQATLIVFE